MQGSASQIFIRCKNDSVQCRFEGKHRPVIETGSNQNDHLLNILAAFTIIVFFMETSKDMKRTYKLLTNDATRCP